MRPNSVAPTPSAKSKPEQWLFENPGLASDPRKSHRVTTREAAIDTGLALRPETNPRARTCCDADLRHNEDIRCAAWRWKICGVAAAASRRSWDEPKVLSCRLGGEEQETHAPRVRSTFEELGFTIVGAAAPLSKLISEDSGASEGRRASGPEKSEASAS